jgi:cytolysin (calcineurin-like family phosphatase)
MLSLSRRQFLATSTAGLASTAFVNAKAAEPVAFFVVGDTHFLADKADPKKLDARSAGTNTRLIDALNKLPGTSIPNTAGGGTVLAPQGLIHAGDCIDSGDKPYVAMQETEWAAFTEQFGLTGQDGRLKMPVFEVHGNHDSPRGDGLAVKKITERNKCRPGVSNVSPNGVHYSWDWGRVHFVCLGIVVGEVKTVSRKRRYAPLDSLDFLVSDLKNKVGASGRPVVITHHVDMLRYAGPANADDASLASKEWDPADVKGYYDALRNYNVAAILYGHTHARNVYKWDGGTKPAAKGVPTFNVDNSGHYFSKNQAFYYMEISDGGVTAREYQTTDAWETGSWTPQVWTA